jgi:hypothetical protein
VAIRYEELRKESIESAESFNTAQNIAKRLEKILNRKDVEDKIRKKDKPDTKSQEIQAIILHYCKEEGLGFESEAKGLFAEYACEHLRPDFVNLDAKILFEVERGKTHMNNMDLLDIWKCHICDQTDYLFLLIPKVRQNRRGERARQFHHTYNKLKAFFKKKNYINVDAVFLFGYGRD